jgi:hypothetical protein
MAHVFAASDYGPRPAEMLSEAERGAFDNLILLCPVCHTLIDKAEQDFPDKILATWKRNHQNRLAKIFGAVHLNSRAEVSTAIVGSMRENQVIFEEYSPDLDYRQDPESEMASAWRRKMRERIIPNNRRVLAILEANTDHMIEGETRILELFRQHIHDLETRHITDVVPGPQRRFPKEINDIMGPL